MGLAEPDRNQHARPDYPHRHSKRLATGLQRDGSCILSRRVLPGHFGGNGPFRRHLCKRRRRADRAGGTGLAGIRGHHAILHSRGDRAGTPERLERRTRGRVHPKRPLPWRHSPDGREVRQTVLSSRPAVCMAGQHRPLAGHRRHGPRRIFRACHRIGAGRPAPATGKTLQAGRARPGDPVDHPFKHKNRGSENRRHQGPGSSACNR